MQEHIDAKKRKMALLRQQKKERNRMELLEKNRFIPIDMEKHTRELYEQSLTPHRKKLIDLMTRPTNKIQQHEQMIKYVHELPRDELLSEIDNQINDYKKSKIDNYIGDYNDNEVAGITKNWKSGEGLLPHRTTFAKKSKVILASYGNEKISTIQVFKRPLNQLLQLGINLLTLKRNDKLYHLGMFITTDRGNSMILEKTDHPYVNINKLPPKGTESRTVRITTDITTNQMIQKTIERIGSEAFFKYSALHNNCQRFIIELLKTIGQDTTELHDFVIQDLKHLNISDDARRLINTVTDVKSALVEGEGLNFHIEPIAKTIKRGSGSFISKPKEPELTQIVPHKPSKIEMAEDKVILKKKKKPQPKKEGGDIASDFRDFGNRIKSGFTNTFTPQLGRDIASTLIHEALPAVTGAIGSTLGVLNPALGIAGTIGGHKLGDLAANAIGNKTGLGLANHIVQSVLFKKNKFSQKKAVEWLNKNGYIHPKVDVEKNTLRFRQISPEIVKKQGYSHYIIKKLGDSGIELVIVYNE